MSYLYRGKNMEVNGTLINYYFHCQRQCYLHGNRLNLEDESENVKIGKALHEEKYKDDKNSEIAIGNIRLDKLTAKYLTETKKSDADLVAAKWQLLYYLKILKSKGIIRKGRIEVIEKNKQNKSFIEVELTEIEEKELDKIVIKIKELLENDEIPLVLNESKCKKMCILCILLYIGGVVMKSTKYITSMGDLKRKDDSLCFRKSGKNIYLPVENIKEIYCLNEISLNTKLLDFISSKNIIIHFFNYYQGYSGTFYPKDKYTSGKLLIKQVETFNNYRIDIAKAIVNGIAINVDETLYHYYKHGKNEVKETIDWLRKEVPKRLKKAEDIKMIMAVEGEIWQRFYSMFRYILPEDFIMNKRVKRPPDNPINALISFGNTLLYTKTISAIYQTHLNQSISFLHEPTEQRFSLSLDLSEVFKPIIVFKTIFELVNTKRLTVEKHFDKKTNYCLLNDKGRDIFIEAFENRMETKFLHTKLKRKITYKTAIKYDGYKLIKTIFENKLFIPFSIKDKY